MFIEVALRKYFAEGIQSYSLARLSKRGFVIYSRGNLCSIKFPKHTESNMHVY